MEKVIRKIIVWSLIVIVALPAIVAGSLGYKFFGLAVLTLLIVWDNTATKVEKPRTKKKSKSALNWIDKYYESESGD